MPPRRALQLEIPPAAIVGSAAIGGVLGLLLGVALPPTKIGLGIVSIAIMLIGLIEFIAVFVAIADRNLRVLVAGVAFAAAFFAGLFIAPA